MTINPRASLILNVSIGVLTAAIGGTAYYNAFFDAATTAKILAAEGFSLLVLNAILHAVSSNEAGPLSK